MNKKQIIEKFSNAIQKVGFILQQIMVDDDQVKNLEEAMKQRKMVMTQAMLRQNEVENSIPEEIQNEARDRVDSEIISGYSDLNVFLANPSPTQTDFLNLKQTLKQTSINLRKIPDEISGMFKDKQLNFKTLCSCVGIDIVNCNKNNTKAAFDFLEKIKTPQTQERAIKNARKM